MPRYSEQLCIVLLVTLRQTSQWMQTFSYFRPRTGCSVKYKNPPPTLDRTCRYFLLCNHCSFTWLLFLLSPATHPGSPPPPMASDGMHDWKASGLPLPLVWSPKHQSVIPRPSPNAEVTSSSLLQLQLGRSTHQTCLKGAVNSIAQPGTGTAWRHPRYAVGPCSYHIRSSCLHGKRAARTVTVPSGHLEM